MPYTYILECRNKSLYTGSTRNLEKRIYEHEQGLGSNYTKIRRPVKLIYYEEYERIDDAFNREKQLQTWSNKKKLALVNREFEDLSKLANPRKPSI
ncbi:MAG: GIY-YIG nuclease family protein [Pseudomonadota bacterium]